MVVLCTAPLPVGFWGIHPFGSGEVNLQGGVFGVQFGNRISGGILQIPDSLPMSTFLYIR